ncbi:MAG: long-chain fatty acid transport protein, partial [Cyclobacteriaceae bacterium]|nr:long-chain fatty acid transport protein [Cyclobacteriaceae bacterium]
MIRYLRIYVLLVFPITVYAQGGHYWTESFGSRSMLLNGVVIGSVEDLGAVYYNPARISQLSSPAFVISGQVYEYKKTNIKDGLGDGIDLKQSNFGSGPSLVSGTFKLKFLEGHHFAYAFLTRTQADNTFNFSINKFGDFIEAFPGEEYFSGEITSTAKLKDEWIGLSWSYPINEKLSVGFSGFYSGLNRDVFLKLQLQAYKPDSANTGMYIEKRAYSFKTNGILGKLGVSWQDEKYS